MSEQKDLSPLPLATQKLAAQKETRLRLGIQAAQKEVGRRKLSEQQAIADAARGTRELGGHIEMKKPPLGIISKKPLI